MLFAQSILLAAGLQRKHLITFAEMHPSMAKLPSQEDTALAFAERITVLHYGEVIVEGTRAEVVADPRTREVYLGD